MTRVGAFGPDPLEEDEARLRGWRRRFFVVYGLASVAVVVAVVIGAAAGSHARAGRSAHWWIVLAVAAGAVVVLGGTGAVAWWVQSRPGRTRQLLAAGDRRTHRRVGIALRKGRRIEPEQRRCAQAIVDLYAHRRWVVWLRNAATQGITPCAESGPSSS